MSGEEINILLAEKHWCEKWECLNTFIANSL